MTADLLSRVIGLILFTAIGARIGADPVLADVLGFPTNYTAVLFGLVGTLVGVVLTPWLTVRPVRAVRNLFTQEPIEKLLMSLVGLTLGLTIALLLAYPLSLAEAPLSTYGPVALSVVAAYLGATTFYQRTREITDMLTQRFNRNARSAQANLSRKLLIDTSSLIDGRIVEVAETGFLGGTLIVPRFVLNELHRVADSSDPLRRGRGRRGLNLLNKLQRDDMVSVRIIDDDFEDIAEVDNKLVALALEMNAALITNDYNLGEVAEAQGVTVLNINILSNAVRPMYIPGEQFSIRIFQEGRDPDQGVGYLDDGTMVVIEQGKDYMDRTIEVEVTKLINRNTGRMIFARPL